MGSCLSSPAFHIPTAILILHDGGLQEFAEPFKVAEIVREKAGFFVCDSDDMAFDKYICPLSAEEEVQVDHLYFLLPHTKLQRPLQPSEMATLAVKAGAAMQRSLSNRTKNRCKVVPLMEESGKELEFSKAINPTEKSRSVKKLIRAASTKGSGAGKEWRSKLPTIPEALAY